MIVAPGPVDAVRDRRSPRRSQRGVAVSFTYQAPDAAPTTRTVDPVKVLIANGAVVPAGVVPPAPGDAHVPPRSRQRSRADRHPDRRTARTPCPEAFETGDGDIVARIRFPESVAPLLGDFLDAATVDTVDGVVDRDDAHRRRAQPQAPGRAPRRRRRDRRAGRRAHAAAAEWAEAGLAQYRYVAATDPRHAASPLCAGYTANDATGRDRHVRNLTGWHLLIILAVILLLFGAAKLPALAKSMGQSARVFKGEMKAMKDEDATDAGKTEQSPNPRGRSDPVSHDHRRREPGR